MHKHKCVRCRYIWEHDDSHAGSNAAHSCPNCGSEDFGNAFRYHGCLQARAVWPAGPAVKPLDEEPTL